MKQEIETSQQFYVDNKGDLREFSNYPESLITFGFIKPQIKGYDIVTGLIGPNKKNTLVVNTEVFGEVNVFWILAPSKKYDNDFHVVSVELVEDCDIARLNFDTNPVDVILQRIIRDQIDGHELEIEYIDQIDLSRWI